MRAGSYQRQLHTKVGEVSLKLDRPAVPVLRRVIESKAAGEWALPIGQKAEIADAYEASGKQVQQETPQKFVER